MKEETIKYKAPLTYYGGKQRIAVMIQKYIPEHHIYCEPFFGGGAVFFAKKPSYLEIINDHLIRHYKCKECGKDFTLLNKRNVGGHIYCSAECKHKFLSKHTGGYRNGSGRGKSGWYKGIKCDSSWELAFVIYHLDNNLKIKRCKEVRKYTYKNVVHRYHPDFVTDEGIIEIKGYKTEQWSAKEEQNQDVKILYKKEIKPYIDYVTEKYGINFIEMYDNSKPAKKNKKYFWMHKDGVNTMILVENLDEYVKNGWVRGQTKKKNR